MAVSRKRKASSKKDDNEGGIVNLANPTAGSLKESSKGSLNRRKRARITPSRETEYFEEKPSLMAVSRKRKASSKMNDNEGGIVNPANPAAGSLKESNKDNVTRRKRATITHPQETKNLEKKPNLMVVSRKRKASSKKDVNEGGIVNPANPTAEPIKESSKGSLNTRKRARITPPRETEYFEEKRNLEDLWKAAFLVGTEWDNMDKLHEINWKFTNLENAFEDGGELSGKRVYLFGCTEAQMLNVNGMDKVTLIPVVVAVVSPIPPSDKIAVKSVMREAEEIIPMKSMKMDWIPYIPLENRQNQVERLNPQIYAMGCTQRRSALKLLKVERIKKYDYCLPYLQPLNRDENEVDTVVQIMYPMEPPIVCDFDWELDELEEFTDELVKEEALPEEQKDKFKEYVKVLIKEKKQAQRRASEARKKAVEEMDPNALSALQNMRLYKFYPVQTADTPDISQVKWPFINRYYGKAHAVI